MWYVLCAQYNSSTELTIQADETKGVFLHIQMEEPWACLRWSRQELIRTDLMMHAYNAPVKLCSAPLWSLLLTTKVISLHGNLIRGLSKVCFCIYNLLLVVSGFFFFFLEAEAKRKNGARYIVQCKETVLHAI